MTRTTRTPGPRTRCRRPAWTLLAAGAAGLVGFAPAWPDDGDGQDVEATRDVLEQWVEVQSLISREKRDWALGRQMLEDRIELVQREIEGLRAKIGATGDSIAGMDETKTALASKEERLREASSTLAARIGTLETRTKALLAKLPEPIRERALPLSQRLPDDPTSTETPLGDRFMNVIGTLNLVNKFQREVNLSTEVRTLADGAVAEVTAIYAGIGQGWYVSTNGEAAGVGRSGADGWVWTPTDEHAAEIRRAIAIFNNEEPADFASLPVRID